MNGLVDNLIDWIISAYDALPPINNTLIRHKKDCEKQKGLVKALNLLSFVKMIRRTKKKAKQLNVEIDL